MHGTGCWLGWFIPMCAGAEIVTLTNRSLDPHEVLQKIEDHKATSITIVGDSFAKPLVRAIDEGKPDGGSYDLSSVGIFLSSGVMWTTEVKQQMLERIEQAVLVDAMGSSEGSMGTQITMKGMSMDTAKFTQMPTTKVFTDDDREVTPGSDEVGMVAAGGNVPLGYYKDEEKSARTFRVIDGVRYSFPGDLAMVAEDGTLILLGRGNQVINTGGEKVFPEEVEEAVKRVDGIVDCLVVGVENEKFGQAVTAVASIAEGADGRRGNGHRRGQERPRRLQGAEVGGVRPGDSPGPERQGRLQDGAHPRRGCHGLDLQLLDEEVEHPLHARVVTLFGQHRVVRLPRCSAIRSR